MTREGLKLSPEPPLASELYAPTTKPSSLTQRRQARPAGSALISQEKRTKRIMLDNDLQAPNWNMTRLLQRMSPHSGRKENSLLLLLLFFFYRTIHFTERGLTFHVTLENKNF